MAAFSTAESSLRDQTEACETRPESLSRLAAVLHNLGMVHQTQGLDAAAIDCLTEALELQAQAVKLEPFHQGYRTQLQDHRELLDQALGRFKHSRLLESQAIRLDAKSFAVATGDQGLGNE